jgi:hypothetical protein
MVYTITNIPCTRIVSDIGDGFTVGCIIGSIWYFTKGAFYSTKKQRFKSGINLLSKRAAVLGGKFAIWTFVFSSTNCLIAKLRNRDDLLNSVISGFSARFAMMIRGGVRLALGSGIIGGLLVGMCEIIMNMYFKLHRREYNDRINKGVKENLATHRERKMEMSKL